MTALPILANLTPADLNDPIIQTLIHTYAALIAAEANLATAQAELAMQRQLRRGEWAA